MTNAGEVPTVQERESNIPNGHRIQVAVVDDQPILREGLKSIVSSQPDMAFVGESGTAEDFLQLIAARNVDVAVVEVILGDHGPVNFVRAIRSLSPTVRILVLSSVPENLFVGRLLVAGANGFCNKRFAVEHVLEAIRKLASGGSYAHESLLESLTDALRHPATIHPQELLSEREFLVLTRVCLGKSTKEIAEELSLNPKTVSTYKARILTKMKVKSVPQLMHHVIAWRLLE